MIWAALFALAAVIPVLSWAQIVAPHPPLRILIVSDSVNPHGLPPEDLTEPGELSVALAAISGLQTEGPSAILEIATDDLDQATALLELPASDSQAYDVLIYFAHRIPNGAGGSALQEDFVEAVSAFLAAGGGVISFHHGIYRTAGKESMQALLAGEATGGVPWDTVDGQNVIAVSPEHFVASHGLDYSGSLSFEDAELSVPLADYPAFNNTPDERYPNFELLPTGGEIELLFASDYDGQGHVLGYTHRRPGDSGIVVVYQPGEYQPHALEPGNNLQILLNAVLYAGSLSAQELFFTDGFESGDLSRWATP